MIRSLLAWLMTVQIASAQDVGATAQSLYSKMPNVAIVDQISGNCGATSEVNQRLVYCTSRNTIYVARGILDDPSIGYELAHQFGHAIFVQHGVADVALAAIQANRPQEAFLRGQVSRQIDCLAGVIYARAGLAPATLRDWFAQEPFTGSHWGRNPLRVGPKASIGLDARDAWFVKGQKGAEPSVCAVPELPIELLVDPFRG